MVYGRYNYSFHGVYKPTNITGGHHPVGEPSRFFKSPQGRNTFFGPRAFFTRARFSLGRRNFGGVSHDGHLGAGAAMAKLSADTLW